ncbi:lactate utilization protein B [Hyphomicrobium sp.]|uniref:lactate utilization protein B n=1 Tax=Hyphomicrobium sp. TaxID=82 RepID=UPI002FE2513C
MTPATGAFKAGARQALADERLAKALRGLPGGLVAQRTAAKARVPEFEALRNAARDIRDHTLAHLDLYLDAFAAKAEAAGSRVHWAADAAEARTIIAHLALERGARRIAKGKSMVSEEIALNAFLEKLGMEIFESDLGEYLLQIRGETPSHIIAPAIHLSQDQVEADFRSRHAHLDPGRTLDTPELLVAEARAVLRARFLDADIGITGANFLVAETGSAVIVTNEGNGDLSSQLPRTHIVLAAIDKVVPTLADLATLLRVLARSATGQDMTAYTSLLTGPKAPGDPDGPAECHIVIVDNGRTEMLKGGLGEALRCIRCGACLNHCPIYNAIGGHAYGWVYAGPIGAVVTPAFLGIDSTRDLAAASTFCGKCEEVCPVKIPITRLLRSWRVKSLASGAGRWERTMLAAWSFLARRPRLYHLAARLGMAVLAASGRTEGAFRWLPFAGGWTASRDFPAPQGRTFQKLWAEHQKRTPQ